MSVKMCLYNVSASPARWTVKTDGSFQLYSVCPTVCSQNINKQNVNIADETLTDYSFLSRYHFTKSKNYLKRRYRIRHWIPMFIGTPCMIDYYYRKFHLSSISWTPDRRKQILHRQHPRVTRAALPVILIDGWSARRCPWNLKKHLFV